VQSWCSPGGWEIPYLIGTNASFRRDRLIEVGGFDEEFEYYLDESDVCMRLVDAGYLIMQSEHAPVHHKYLASWIRDPQRITLNLFPIIKNKIYFSLVNGRLHSSLTEIYADNAQFARNQRLNLERHRDNGSISDEQLAEAERTIERGWEVGVPLGFRGREVLLGEVEDGTPGHAFRPFPTRGREGRLRVCLVSQTLPPDEIGGISRYISQAARALALLGHEVRVIANGADHSTVDLEDGVWVHRVLKEGPVAEPVLVDPPGRVWSNASAVADEIVRLNQHRPIDAVYGALWDTESIAVLERSAVPVVTSLVTTIAITLEMRPEWRQDEPFLRDYLTPLIATERSLVQRTHLIHALSTAVATEVERTAQIELDPNRLVVAPLGAEDMAGDDEPPGDGDAGCEILFVGRFEKRKGIDLILGAIPGLVATRPDVRIVLIGRDDLPGDAGMPYRTLFERDHHSAPWFHQIEFRGVVDDDALWAAYRHCDVFVAPSRFESFGLIFIEAMLCGTPVVALRAGAAVEVVDDGVTGLLVADDVAAVRSALLDLVDDPARRVQLGRAGRERYERDFTVAAMGERLELLLGSVHRISLDDDRWRGALSYATLPDGTVGAELGHGEVWAAFPAEGALSVAIWLPASSPAPVLVRSGAWEEKVSPPTGDAFVHVHVPLTGTERAIAISGPSEAALAGAILVAPQPTAAA
jgi:glycosyltransferase involved in cell wall biosynthesis